MKIFVCHQLLPQLLLLFCCRCLATDSGKVNAGNQHSIYKTKPRIEAMRSHLKINKEKSKDHFLTTNSSRADFPCPPSAAIAPCTCSVVFNRINLDCTFVESLTQLMEVFQQDFPVTELYEFTMGTNSVIDGFPSFMNGITFESVYLYPGPYTLAVISDQFFLDLKDTLKTFRIYNSKLSSDFFPFLMLPSMDQLDYLGIYTSDIKGIPLIRAPKLTLFALENSPLEEILNGTFPIGTGPMEIRLYDNQIHTLEAGSFFFSDQDSAESNELIRIEMFINQLQSLEAGTFPLRNGPMIVHVSSNQISTIEPGTFVFPESTGEEECDGEFNQEVSIQKLAHKEGMFQIV